MKVNRLHLCSTGPILCLVLLAALAAVVAAAPIPAAAQPSALQASLASLPTAPNAATTSPAAAQSDQSPDSPQKIYGYLHAPAVHSIGRMLHLSVNATSNIFLAINFLILFLLIAAPLAKIMPRIMRKRSETLRQSIKTAREVGEEAKARLSAVEAKLAGLDEEIQKMRALVEQEALEDQARIKAALEEEKTRIVAAAEQELGVAAVQARRALRTFAATLAIEHASKQLVLTPETDRALIAEFIGQVAGDHAGNDGANRGGQN